jgi:hypothetical protein
MIRAKLAGNLQEIAIAAYQGYLDGVDTAWVANQYGVTQKQALKTLKDIVSGKVYDETLYPFGEFDESMNGVAIADGTTFAYGDNAEYKEGRRGFNHYLWFSH